MWVEWQNSVTHGGVPLWQTPRSYVLLQQHCRMGLLWQAMVLHGHESIEQPQGKKMPQTPAQFFIFGPFLSLLLCMFAANSRSSIPAT